jgi:hypothetical protein
MVIGLSLLVCSSGAQALAQKFEGQCSPHQPPGGRIPGAPADLKACWQLWSGSYCWPIPCIFQALSLVHKSTWLARMWSNTSPIRHSKRWKLVGQRERERADKTFFCFWLSSDRNDPERYYYYYYYYFLYRFCFVTWSLEISTASIVCWCRWLPHRCLVRGRRNMVVGFLWAWFLWDDRPSGGFV